MASTVITPNQDALVSEIHVAAPAERIFQALIDPKQVMQWWNSPDCQIESFSFDPRKGGCWTYDTQKTKLNINGTSKFHCEGEVLEYDPPRVLAYTWIANWHEQPTQCTVVHCVGTLVRVTHSGLAELPVSRKDYSGGWPGVLREVKKFIER